MGGQSGRAEVRIRACSEGSHSRKTAAGVADPLDPGEAVVEGRRRVGGHRSCPLRASGSVKKNGLDPAGTAVIGVGLGATAVAAMEQGQIDAAVMLDPSVTVLQGTHKDLRILSDTRTQKDTLETFGGEYPGGALYSTVAWINGHEKETQALTNAMLATIAWIHSHSPEEIMAKMPDEMVGKNKELYLAALKNTIPMFSETGKMDPKGADAVLAVFSVGSPEVANAKIDVSKTFTNKFVDQAKKTTGSAK